MTSTRCFLLDLLKSIEISQTGSPNKIRQKIIHKQSQEGREEGVQFIIYWVYTQSLKLIFLLRAWDSVYLGWGVKNTSFQNWSKSVLAKERVKKNSKSWLLTKKGGGVGEKTNLLIFYFIFLQTMNMASRLLDSWRTVKINHISTVHTIIKSLKRS